MLATKDAGQLGTFASFTRGKDPIRPPPFLDSLVEREKNLSFKVSILKLILCFTGELLNAR